jgi:hypothetical protein
VQVFALGDTGMRVVHYLPNYWLALEGAGCAPGMVAAVLLWLACCCCFAPGSSTANCAACPSTTP